MRATAQAQVKSEQALHLSTCHIRYTVDTHFCSKDLQKRRDRYKQKGATVDKDMLLGSAPALSNFMGKKFNEK